MMRTIKLTSPMSLGSWILSAFSAAPGLAAASEIDRITGSSAVPLGPLRAGAAGGRGAGRYLGPLRSRRRWPSTPRCCSPTRPPRPGTRRTRSCRSSSSAPRASLRRVWRWSPRRSRRPARRDAWPCSAWSGDLVAMKVMERRMDPVAAEPLHHGAPGPDAAVERKTGRRRRIGHAVRRAPPRRRSGVRIRADGGVGLDAVRRVRGRAATRPAIRATPSSRRNVGSPPDAPRASPTTRSPPDSDHRTSIPDPSTT